MTGEWLLYLRKSVGYAGISRQRASTTDHIARLGGTVAREFPEADRTAYRDPLAPLPPRPKFAEMLAEMGRRPGIGIAAWHADRLGRDPETTEVLIRACMRGSHLITTTRGGDYDLSTANGRKRLRDDINQAAHEVDHNTERLIEAKAEKAAEGRWLGGQRPFGWRLDRTATDEDGVLVPGVLVLDEREAALIAKASEDVLAGVAVRAIARAWNAAGVTGSGGGRWTTSSVHKVLIRPRNAGLAEHHGQVAAGVTAAWPPITDEATWRGVRALLTSPGRRDNLGGTAASHLLTGIALCGGCGITVVAGVDAKGTPRYRCARHVRQLPPRPGVAHASRRVADVDALIAAVAVGRLKREDAALLLRADHSAGRRELLGRQAAAQARKGEQWRLYRAGVISDAELTEGRREIAAELAGIGGQLEALDAADVLAPMLADPAGAWDRAPLTQMRAVVAALVHVTLMPGARFSRPPGWKPGDGQFDPRMVDVRWVRRLPDD